MARDDEFDDDDYAGFDTSPDDQDATDECPHCGASIYDDAERCSNCGEYLSREDATGRGIPLRVVVVVGVLILIVVALLCRAW